MTDLSDPVEASRFLQRYAKQFAAGAFATPTRKELTAKPWMIRAAPEAVVIVKQLTRNSVRRDWRARAYVVPGGSTVATHVARVGDAVPDLSGVDYAQTYRDDPGLDEIMRGRGYALVATRISAASELTGVWGPPGNEWHEHPVDEIGAGRVPGWETAQDRRLLILDEVRRVERWADDFPFYSDGSWDAVSLRGYQKNDPLWGVKPMEMGPKWHAENPGAKDLRCEWTWLADRMPETVAMIEEVEWLGSLDRVRLMRMSGSRGSVLRRHCDITDRSAGTSLGQMVRFFVPIVTDPTVTLRSWSLGGVVSDHHPPPWEMTYLDIRKPHAVTNPTSSDRINLAIDAYVTAEVREVIEGVQ
jgi:hypothetical protein